MTEAADDGELPTDRRGLERVLRKHGVPRRLAAYVTAGWSPPPKRETDAEWTQKMRQRIAVLRGTVDVARAKDHIPRVAVAPCDAVAASRQTLGLRDAGSGTETPGSPGISPLSEETNRDD